MPSTMEMMRRVSRSATRRQRGLWTTQGRKCSITSCVLAYAEGVEDFEADAADDNGTAQARRIWLARLDIGCHLALRPVSQRFWHVPEPPSKHDRDGQLLLERQTKPQDVGKGNNEDEHGLDKVDNGPRKGNRIGADTVALVFQVPLKPEIADGCALKDIEGEKANANDVSHDKDGPEKPPWSRADGEDADVEEQDGSP